MAKYDAVQVILPIVNATTNVGDAIETTNARSSPAVISLEGGQYRLHKLDTLVAASTIDKSTPVANIDWESVSFGQTDFSLLTDKQRSTAALKADQSHEFTITSIVSDFEGNLYAAGYIDPRKLFRIVSKAWKCPKDGQKFPKSGTCAKHGVVLVPDT